MKILNQDKNEVARGLVAYSAKDTLMIKGRRSSEIEDILGYQGRDELVHGTILSLFNRRTNQIEVDIKSADQDVIREGSSTSLIFT